MNNEREVYAVAVVKSKAKPYLFDIEIIIILNISYRKVRCCSTYTMSCSVSHCRVSEQCRALWVGCKQCKALDNHHY